MATVDEMMSGVRDAMTVRRVFGDPIEKDGVTFVPVASIRGGGGGGGGEDPEKHQTGSGAGFAIKARPVGAYVLRGGDVEWQPALDVARLGMAGIVLAGLMTIAVASVFGQK